MLHPAGSALWLADGPIVRFLGAFPYTTRMAVARLENGDLWIWSPVALDDALAAAVSELGPVRHLVSPNKIHHLAMGEWAKRFPDALLYASPDLARKRTDLSFHAELGDAPEPAWAGQIDQVVFRGSFLLDEVVFFHRASRTALVCDLVQRFDWQRVKGLAGVAMWLDGVVGPNGSTPRDWRATWWRRAPAREAFRTALGWSPERLVIAHGELPEGNGRNALAKGLHWLR